MTKRRLFIAINLPERVKKQLFDWELKLENEYKIGEFRGRTINWVIRNNLHITLIFIGYATDDETYEIAKTMRGVAKKHQQFFITLERIITGPPDGNARMFWVEGEKSQELAELQNDLENTLAGGSLTEKEVRAFRPHITLARFKSNVSKIIKEQGDEEKKIDFQVPVEGIELMQSNLHRTGPGYTILESVKLGE